MEAKPQEIKTTDITLTIKDDIGGFGFTLAQLLIGKLLMNGEDPVDRKNYDTIYQILSEVNKKAVNHYVNTIKNNPQFIARAKAQAKEQDEKKMKDWAGKNKGKGMVN